MAPIYSFANLNTALTAIRAAANENNGFFATIRSRREALISSLEALDLDTQTSEAERLYNRLIANVETAQRDLIGLSLATILDRSAAEALPEVADDNDIGEMLRAIYRKMIVDTDTVAKNTVTLGSVTRTLTNSTAGNLHLTKKLPGDVAPGPGKIWHTQLADVDSELPESDSAVAICNVAGYFALSGKPPPSVPYGEAAAFGNAGTVNVPSDGANNKIANFFETFTTVNEPDGWTIVAGAAGTEIKEDAVTVMRGSKSLRLEGTSEIKFPIATLVAARQNLLLSVWLKKAAGTTSGTYKLQMKGTGMTTQETSAFNATDLSSSAWTEKTLHLAVPASIPSDLAIHLVTTSVDTTDGIYVDGGQLQPYTYWAGLGAAITIGPADYALGDKFSLTITNNYAGTIQTWIARAHGFQLPSA